MKKHQILWKRCISCLTLMMLGTSLAMAQAIPPPPPTGGPNFSSGRSWYSEALIVIVMFALALYVVCRSSRRN